MYNCQNCFKEITKLRGSSLGKFCSPKCQADLRFKNQVNEWRNGNDCGWTGKTCRIKCFIRKYLLEYFNYKCSQCGWSEINQFTGKVPLEINHIDGNPKNCVIENLQVLCPNCHSLTFNFRNSNKVRGIRQR